MLAGRCGAPCEVAAQHWSSATTPTAAPAATVPPSQRDLDVNPRADTIVRGEAPDLRCEALLSLDSYDLRARQRSPDGKKPEIGAKVENPPLCGMTNPVRRYTFRQYISRAPAV